MKLFPKFLIASLALALIPFGILAISTGTSISRAIFQEELSDLESVSSDRVDSLFDFFQTKEYEITLISRSQFLSSAMKPLAEMLHAEGSKDAYTLLESHLREQFELFSKNYYMENFSIISNQGELIYSEGIEELLGSKLQNRGSALAQLYLTIDTLLAPQFSHLEPDPKTGRTRVLLGAPIFTNNIYQGAIICQITLEQLYSLFFDYSGLGETGEMLVGYEENGYLHFAIPTRHLPDEAFTIEMGSDLALPMQQAVQAEQGKGESIDYRGVKILAAWHYFPYLDLGLVVKQDYSEALFLAKKFTRFIALLTLIFTVVVAITAYFLAKKLSKPIHDLQIEMEEIARTGDLTLKHRKLQGDEIGKLTATFDELLKRLKQSYTSVERLNKEIDYRLETEEQIKSFISVVAHEIRNPIIPIQEGIKITLEGELSEEQRQMLHIAEASCRRLIHLASDLLDYRKLSTGKMSYTMQACHLNELVREIAKSFKTDTSRIELALNLDERIPQVSCDKERVLQVLFNLVSNAFKYTIKGKITIKTSMIDNFVKVEVIDSGRGISHEDLEKVFDVFVRISRPGQPLAPGAGLGLAICKDIIEQHGGKIGVTSKLDQGTCFFFTLPVTQSH